MIETYNSNINCNVSSWWVLNLH